MAWEWELRDTCQTSVRYAALGDSMLSWSAAEGAPTGAADFGEAEADTFRRRADAATASNLANHNAGESFCSPGRRRRVGSERS